MKGDRFTLKIALVLVLCCLVACKNIRVLVGPDRGYYFTPRVVNASVGDTIVWDFDASSGIPHSVTEGNPDTCAKLYGGLVDTGVRSSGTFEWTVQLPTPPPPSAPYVMNYICTLHCNIMVGIVNVYPEGTVFTTAPPTSQPPSTEPPTSTTPIATTDTQSPTTAALESTESPGTTEQATTPAETDSTSTPLVTTPTAEVTLAPTTIQITSASYVISLRLESCPSFSDQASLQQEWASVLGIAKSQVQLVVLGCKRQTSSLYATVTIQAVIANAQLNYFVSSLNSGSAGPTTRSLVVPNSAGYPAVPAGTTTLPSQNSSSTTIAENAAATTQDAWPLLFLCILITATVFL